jgi:hypothetical protein
MLANTILKIITGDKDIIFTDIQGPRDIYMKVRDYFLKKDIEITIENKALGIESWGTEKGKLVTKEEMDYWLMKSVFGFIFKLKCEGVGKNDQFDSVEDALVHYYVVDKPIKEEEEVSTLGQVDGTPADY